jgi:nitroreductase
MPSPIALAALLQARETVLPKRLGAPGPDAAQLQALLAAAGHAPDHGRLLPWRFVLVPQEARAALGEAFAQALLERDAQATPEQQAQAREKAERAPAARCRTCCSRPPRKASARRSPVARRCSRTRCARCSAWRPTSVRCAS